MATPTTAITRYDLSLSYTEFNAAMNRRRFIAHKVMPAVEVGNQSAEFSVLPTEATLPPAETLTRGPRGAYKRDDFEWGTDSYQTAEHGAEEILDDRTNNIYANEMRAEQVKRDRLIQRIGQEYEIALADTLFNTTTWNGSSLTTDVETAWDVKDSADPIADIDAARDKVLDACGYPANAVVLNEKVMRNIIRTDRVESLIKYSGHSDPARLAYALAMLADLLQVDHIIVAHSAMKNTSDRGDTTPTLSQIWSDEMVSVCRIATDNVLESMEPAVGRTIVWTGDGATMPGTDENIGITIEEYREEGVRGGVLRGRTEYQIKTLQVNAAHLITGVKTSE